LQFGPTATTTTTATTTNPGIDTAGQFFTRYNGHDDPDFAGETARTSQKNRVGN
jgi:hypothetical protein